jgi:hypothetical protein
MEIGKAHGTAHLLVNNAAISASAAFSTASGADFERIVRFCLSGMGGMRRCNPGGGGVGQIILPSNLDSLAPHSEIEDWNRRCVCEATLSACPIGSLAVASTDDDPALCSCFVEEVK